MAAHQDVPDLLVVVPAPLHAMVPLHLLDAQGVLPVVLPAVRDHVDQDAQVDVLEHAKAVAALDVLAPVVADVHQVVLQDAPVHQNLLAVHRAQTHVVAVVVLIALKIVVTIVQMDVAQDAIMGAAIAVKVHVALPASELVRAAA